MFSTLKDLLFPKRCVGCGLFGSFLCDNCFSSISFETVSVCPICNRNSITGATHKKCATRYSLDGLSSGVVYKGVIKKLVYQFKYSPYLSSLKEIIGALLYESVIQNEIAYKKLSSSTLLIPVPLYKAKIRKRGYNHAALIAEELSKQIPVPIYEKALVRKKETKPQFSLSRVARYENVKDAFEAQNNKKVAGENIILIDDLATSCATLNACANVLKRNGVKNVWAITFARE